MNLESRFLAPLALLLGLALPAKASAQTPLGSATTQPAPQARPAAPPVTATPAAGSPAAAPAATVRTVHVLGFDSDNADDQVEALTTALRTRVRAMSNWTLGGVTTSLSMVTAALKCPQRPDTACTQRMGDEFKADRVMYGWVNRTSPREVTAEVHLWVRGDREIVANETYPDTLTDAKDPKLQAVADRLLEKLLGERPPPPVVARPKEPVIEKKKEEEPKPPPSRGVSARTVIGWTLIGVGVGAGVFGAVEGVRFLSLQSDNKDDAKDPKAPADFCSPRTDACSRYEDAKTARTLEFIGIGAGVALVGTGVVLLLTDHSKEAVAKNGPASGSGGESASSKSNARKWNVAPSVGPRGGGVNLNMAW
ncbi:hypothetical protein LZC95_52595 [Pendulispora brunnea]|uniref:Uncharacterized protein n=1 Tax=Pendulispora brunnea TaxID=2905690 RepID=A0ABZ2KBW4_9BACT